MRAEVASWAPGGAVGGCLGWAGGSEPCFHPNSLSDYAAAQLRQYQRLTRQIKPDLEHYERLKELQ